MTDDENPYDLSERKTRERFKRREAQARSYVARAEGRVVCEKLLPDLSRFMLSEAAPPTPGDLRVAMCELRDLASEELALCALAPLLHGITRRRKKDKKTAEMKLKLAMGRALRDQLFMKGLLKEKRTQKVHKRITGSKNKHVEAWKYWERYKEKYREEDWSEEQFVRAGNWLLDCVYHTLPEYIVRGPDGFPCLTERGGELAPVHEDLVYRNPVFQPSTRPLNDWTDLRCGCYWDDGTRISATFVRDSHPDTRKAIERAFHDGSMQQHVDGVNTLQRVGWKINTAMIPVVEKFAGEDREKVRKEDGKKAAKFLPGPGGVGKKVSGLLVGEDVATAKRLGEKVFRIPMNCDKRGRVFGISHFNFQREDHVRALFQFEEGMPIGPIGPYGGDVNWLMIHVANCADSASIPHSDGISKRILRERGDWVVKHKDMIKAIAEDPENTVHLWRDADKPFSFVAGCMELANVWKYGSSYVTRLPVCFDGSCSGIQHLAMMTRDEITGLLVNLIRGDVPHDVYKSPITDSLIERLREELGRKPNSDEALVEWCHDVAWAEWWLNRLSKSDARKIVKRPAMTFAYSATVKGMAEQIEEIEEHGNAFFLAKHIRRTCKKELRRPSEAMDFIRKLARECYCRGEVLEWRSPTGFPWANRYYEPEWETVNLELLGVRVSHKVADGYKDELREWKTMNAAAPNFVHAMDAAHLIRVVNAAAAKEIKNLAVVHDSFGCLAPQAYELNLVIREEMAKLYAYHDVLKELRTAAGSSIDLPEKGELDPWGVKKSIYAFA